MPTSSTCRVLSASNEFLDALVKEFESECRQTLQVIEQLKKTKPDSKLHQQLESSFYGRLVSLQHDLAALLKEWDRTELEM
ncbi:MAG: hypothetical protein K6T71_01885 [Candidatus Bipolaricaulota bacterium]|nr:hypothetical protein [Candidatus Bipolaricaulota bacterium]